MTIADGLSQGSILSMCQDHEGFLWMGSHEGVNRYDGYGFDHFKHVPGDPTTLSGNVVASIYEDSKKRLWLGTRSGELCRYNPELQNFTRFPLDPENPTSWLSKGILKIVGGQDGLWLGMWQGMGFYHPEKNVFTPVSLRDQPFTVSTLHMDGEHHLWVGVGNEVFVIPPGGMEAERVHFDPNGSPGMVTALVKDRYGMLWIGTGKGLYRYDPGTGKREYFSHAPHEVRSLSHDAIECLMEDSYGILWVGTRNGGLNAVNAYNPADGRVAFQRHVSQKETDPGLNAVWITSLLEDRTGVFWAGTGGHGVGILPPNGRSFRFYSPSGPGHGGKSTSSVYKDRNGNLLMGMFSAGLVVMNKERTELRHHQLDPERSDALSHNWVSGIYIDPDDQLWLATGDGLNRTQWSSPPPEEPSFKHYRWDPQNPNSLAAPTVRHLTGSSNGTLWVATYGGLCKYNPDTDDFLRFRQDPNRADSLSSNRLYHVMCDSGGRLWIGSLGGGLNVLEPDQQSDPLGSFKVYGKSSGSDGVSSDTVMSVLEDRDGVIWLGTNNGLNRFHEETQSFTHYFEKDGLANPVVYGLLQDDQGYIWLSGNRGLTRLDPETGRTRTFSSKDGLQDFEFNGNVAHKAFDGELLFGGTNGFNAFRPETLGRNSQPPNMVFTDFFLMNQPVPLRHEDPRSPLSRAIGQTSSITLDHLQNVFSLRFSALNFENPAKNQYLYWLEGFNKNWVPVDAADRMVSFTNLSPGDYTLRVKSATADNVWNHDGISLDIKVLPPPWKTWWAYAIYGLTVLMAAGYYIRTQRARLAYEQAANRHLKEMDRLNNQLNQKLERQVEERTRDLKISNRELENLERMAALINRETSLTPVLEQVLEQGMLLFPQADRGVILSTRENMPFQLFASRGFEEGVPLERIDFEAVTQSYTAHSQELGSGIYLTRGDQVEEDAFKPPPQSMITMELYAGGARTLMVMGSSASAEAFTPADGQRLIRYREHAWSAVNKALLLQELERRHASLVRRKDQLIQQEKMASLGTLTAGLAHEIRNPINFVNNFARLLKEVVEEMRSEKEWPATLETYARDLSDNAALICKHGSRVEDIVRSIVNLSGETGVDLSPVDLNKLTGKAVEMAAFVQREQTGGRTEWATWELDADLASVMAAPQSLSRALVNILNNALEAVAESGREPRVLIQTTMDDAWVFIRIKDNGTGIPDAQRARLFTPFFTTRDDNRHLGLGLFISYDIVVNQHYGEIDVQSQEGAFTQFIVKIPRVRPTVAPSNDASLEMSDTDDV